jgi:hypothetical protein
VEQIAHGVVAVDTEVASVTWNVVCGGDPIAHFELRDTVNGDNPTRDFVT